jgi:hypothetical protein
MTQAQPNTNKAGRETIVNHRNGRNRIFIPHGIAMSKRGANACLSQRQHPDFLQYQLPSIMPETAVENQPPHQ